jgi:hypothetical protein
MAEQLQSALGAAYRVERELGGSGMSRVFLATEVGLKRPVVIKVLPPELTSEVMAARFVGMVPADSVDRVIAGSRAQLNDETVGPAILWYTLRGDTLGMASLVERMRRSKSGFLPVQLPAGALALARRDTAAAIRQPTMSDSVCLTWCSFARLFLARLLAAKRDDVAAARVYDQDYTAIGIGKIMWMLDRGRVNQRLGNRQKAIDSYAFVTAAWPNADPELKAYVEEARRGLSELRSDPGRR